jgi:ADP-heptose:LPS heptosyltransferase
MVLDRLLQGKHIPTVVISSEELCENDFPTFISVTQSPERVAAIMRACGRVVAADTGMAHVAGMLQTPTTVLAGPTRGVNIYGIYSSVRVIQAEGACTACHRNSPHYQEHCKKVCALLQTITPRQVLKDILS